MVSLPGSFRPLAATLCAMVFVSANAAAAAEAARTTVSPRDAVETVPAPGAYDAAIDAALSRLRRPAESRFATAADRCVAYTVDRAASGVRKACDEAFAAARGVAKAVSHRDPDAW